MPQIEAGVPDDAVNDEDAATDRDASHTVTVVPVATVVSIGGAENPEVGESALATSLQENDGHYPRNGVKLAMHGERCLSALPFFASLYHCLVRRLGIIPHV